MGQTPLPVFPCFFFFFFSSALPPPAPRFEIRRPLFAPGTQSDKKQHYDYLAPLPSDTPLIKRYQNVAT